MKKMYKLIGVLLLAALLIVGCSSEDADQTEDQAPVSEGNSIESEQQEQETQEQEELETEDELEEETSDVESEIKSDVLRDLVNSDEYTVKMNRITDINGEQMEAYATIVVAGDKTATTMEAEGVEMVIIDKDDKTYMVNHGEKTIFVIDQYEEEEPVEPEGDELFPDDLEYVGNGQGDFLGNKRDYEEYQMEVGNVKYYFDGKELDGMEITMDMSKLLDEDEMEEVEVADSVLIDIESFEKQADMSLFELPEDYQMFEQ